jgi:hypothetical protein
VKHNFKEKKGNNKMEETKEWNIIDCFLPRRDFFFKYLKDKCGDEEEKKMKKKKTLIFLP